MRNGPAHTTTLCVALATSKTWLLSDFYNVCCLLQTLFPAVSASKGLITQLHMSGLVSWAAVSANAQLAAAKALGVIARVGI